MFFLTSFKRRTLLRPVCWAAFFVLITVSRASAQSAGADHLPSWNDGNSKRAISRFVSRVTDRNGPDFVSEQGRTAVFDNDGTLWIEQPMYVQLAFALDRVRQLAHQHPEWENQEPFKSVLEGNFKGVEAGGDKAVAQLVMATHAGMTTAQFEQIAIDWISSAKQPRFKRLYTECVYQPMLELLAYLRANGFNVYIVSGGGAEFMRPWTLRTYGIPPEQVIGSTIKTQFEMRNGEPVLMRLAQIDFVDDGPGKPVAINRIIGLRPILAFGNSDGDLEMLQWTAAGHGPHLMGLVHHDDAAREYAYDRNSKFGHLDKALNAAQTNGWIVVSMKNDWKAIFPSESIPNKP
jgi:phosphoserine phosphatase